MQVKSIISLAVIGLYVLVTITLLIWNIRGEAGDMGLFFDQMSKANFLLGPVGFVMGYYFRKDTKE